jgi:hypothetical protein
MSIDGLFSGYDLADWINLDRFDERKPSQARVGRTKSPPL